MSTRTDIVAARLWPLYRRNLAISIVSILISLMVSLWFGGHLSRQLRQFRTTAGRIAAGDLSRLIHLRQVSCVEVMAAYLAQIERHNGQVNALVNLRPADVLLDEAAVLYHSVLQRDAKTQFGKLHPTI